MDNIVYQLPHKTMQNLMNFIGNLPWVQVQHIMKEVTENLKEINLTPQTEEKFVPPPIE